MDKSYYQVSYLNKTFRISTQRIILEIDITIEAQSR